MGLRLLIDAEKQKVRFWSTIVDRYLTDWLTRKEAIQFIRKRKEAALEVEMRDEEENFPANWLAQGTCKFLKREDLD